MFLFADNNDGGNWLKPLLLIAVAAAIFFAVKILTLFLVVGYFILVLGAPLVALILSAASLYRKIKIKIQIRGLKAELQQVSLELGELNSLAISYENQLEPGKQN